MANSKIDNFLKSKYKVQVKSNFILDINFFSNFYLPIIDAKGCALYLFLYSEANNNFASNIFLPSSRMIDFLNLNNKDIERFIKYLEFINLIDVYKNEKENKYLFVVNPPTTLERFKHNFKLIELLVSKIGQENYDFSLKLFSVNNFKNLDQSFLKASNYEFEEIIDLEKNIENSFKFNFDPLFKILDQQKINYLKFWDGNLQNALSDLIILYNLAILDILDIFKFLIKENLKIVPENLQNACKDKFNFKITSLKKLDQAEEINLNNRKKLMQSTHPVKYVELIFSRKIRANEKNIIIELEDKYNFDYFKINGLIDYSRIINKGRINNNYILKIAESLKNEKIITEQEFINFLKDKYRYRQIINQKNNKEPTNYLEKDNDLNSIDNIFEYWRDVKWKKEL